MPARWIDLGLVVVIGIFWGLNWPTVKTLFAEIPPWTLRAAGFSLGAVILFLLTAALGKRLLPTGREWGPLVAAGLFTVFGFNLFTGFGQLHTETSRAAIIAFTMPMWATAFSVPVLGEHLTANRLLSLVIGLSGLAVLILDDPAGLLGKPAGIAFMLGAAISWAIGTVLLKRQTWTIDPVVRTAWFLALSAIPAWIGALLFETIPDPRSLSPLTVQVFAFHILFPTVLCNSLWVLMVHRLPAPVAAIGTLLIPVVGVLSASVLLGDTLTIYKIVALALVLASIALTFWQPKRSS